MWTIADAIAIGLGTLFVLGPFVLLGVVAFALKTQYLLSSRTKSSTTMNSRNPLSPISKQ
jgi:hypothetical protein